MTTPTAAAPTIPREYRNQLLRGSTGETIGECYHRHHEQEEVFYITAGTATFETEQGDVVVKAGELIRFAPGEWQQGANRENSRLEVLAFGCTT
ncbi:cupin domain-containing protein [Haladaptatus sp. SPP-AMP-3]|uniref:cupin domain-containing protein n=1 Tax=Haladaptatus sp. SPP-AMP-3 TaxID=3121295 RepID=UPI003C2F2FA5